MLFRSNAFHESASGRAFELTAQLSTMVEGLDRIIHHEVPAIPMATGVNDLAFNLTNFAKTLRAAHDALRSSNDTEQEKP